MNHLRESFSGVVVKPATVRLSNGALHTIVTIEWGRKFFLRDPFVGVAPIDGLPQLSFDRALAQWRKRREWPNYKVRPTDAHEERTGEINLAAALISFAHPESVIVEFRGQAVTVLSWTTPDGNFALYEPTFGTAVGSSHRAPAQIARDLLLSLEHSRPKNGIVDLVCGLREQLKTEGAHNARNLPNV